MTDIKKQNPSSHIAKTLCVLLGELEKQEEQEQIDYFEIVREMLHRAHPLDQPIDRVRWVKIEEVEANDYNPNSVASKEMNLLYTSILHDGYTQPIVTIRDKERSKYVIIDGFHRYFTAKSNPDILDRNKGRLPIVVLDKDINDRMASTVRHNRARGSHSVNGMSNMVFKMLDNGWSDERICKHLGMDAEELLRLKHITGFSKLFDNTEYSKAWVTRNQIKLAQEHNRKPE